MIKHRATPTKPGRRGHYTSPFAVWKAKNAQLKTFKKERKKKKAEVEKQLAEASKKGLREQALKKGRHH